MAFFGKLYREGNSIKQENNPNPIKILCVEQFGFNHFLNDEIFQVLDTFANTGVNGFRVFGFWPYGKGTETEPYVREGSKYNLDRFNDAYFSYLQRWVEYAYSKNIVVRYELFDRCGLTTREEVSDHHPYNQLVDRDRLAFSDLRNTKLVETQKRYIRKVIETIKPYPNVIFGIMNEFKSNEDWHYEMARYVKSLAPEHLGSGSEEDSPAVQDPNCDLWWCHTGTYEFNTGKPHVSEDIAALRARTGQNKVLGFSTDGFGSRGKPRETPADMRRLAEDANRAGIQLLSFLDQHAYDSSQGPLIGRLSQLNLETYYALVSTFQPTPLGTGLQPEQLPEGVLSASLALEAPWTHANAFFDHNGRAVRATTQNGFLFFGNYQAGYPEQVLTGVFSLYIDNNTYDDAYIAILDVVKNRGQVVASRLLRRTEFPEAQQHVKMTLDFSVDDSTAEYELRVLYLGYAYLAVDGVYVIDPSEITPDDLPSRVSQVISPSPTPSPTPTPEPELSYCHGDEILCIDRFDPSVIARYNGSVHGGTYDQDMFTPSNRGGIEFHFSLDIGRHYIVEMEIEGNIANVHEEEEMRGGKVSLFEMKEQDGAYGVSFQRMYAGYRGTGIFRVMMGSGEENIARVITTSQLSGSYSMENWGNEPHTLKVEVQGSQCRLMIDQYVSKWDKAQQTHEGVREMVMMVGNRIDRYSYQHAITKFKRFKVTYA